MPTFQYEAMDNTGQEVKDQIEAGSVDDAATQIRAMGYFPTQVRELGAKKGKARKAAAGTKSRKTAAIGRVGAKQLCTFTRQLSTLQDAGLPLLRSLKILEGQMKPSVLKNSLIDVVEDIEGGSTLSEAFAKHPKAFDRLYVNMVKAGEAGGVLETILNRLADFKEKAQSLKRKVVGAMIYPVVVICVAAGIIGGIMIFIVPRFEKIFEDFDMTLPAMTQALIDSSNWLANKGYWLLAVPVVFVVACRIIRTNKSGAYALDWIKLKIPLFGKILQKSIVARVTRTLGTLIASGVPILEALNIAVRETTGNVVFTEAFTRVYDSIREGDTIAGPLRQAGIVDDMVVNMIDVGEETGDLDKMLSKVADVYDEEVDTMVEALTSVLEPVMIVFLGVAVGFIVISLFMPLIYMLSELGSKKG